MKHLYNVEPSAFRKGEYVGYSDGVWRIRKIEGRRWFASYRA